MVSRFQNYIFGVWKFSRFAQICRKLKAYLIVRFPLVAHHKWSHFSAFPTICWGARITSKTRTANVGTMAPLPKSCRTHQSPARWHFTSLIEGSHLNHQPQAVTLDRGWIPHGETTKGGDVSYLPTNKLTPAILSNTQCNLSRVPGTLTFRHLYEQIKATKRAFQEEDAADANVWKLFHGAYGISRASLNISQ